MEKFRVRYRERCDVLLMDDIYFLGRGEAVQEEFFHTLNDFFEKGRQVVVASDLHHANVYLGLFGSAEQKKTAAALLEKNRKRIQGLVGKAVILKYTPQLRFIIDNANERGNRVLSILDEIEKTLPPE